MSDVKHLSRLRQQFESDFRYVDRCQFKVYLLTLSFDKTYYGCGNIQVFAVDLLTARINAWPQSSSVSISYKLQVWSKQREESVCSERISRFL